MSERKLSGVIFDADGVLQHGGPFGTEDWIWPARRHRDFITGFYSATPPEALADVSAFISACERALADAGWPQDAATYLARWADGHVIPDPAMLEDVRRLRAAGVACYLGSNQDAFWAAHVETALGYGQLFDGLFISCRLGAAKPQTAFFEAMLAQIPYPRQELIFFDDKSANVEAALACGLEARLFTGRAQYLRDLEERYGLEP
ncbi:HAD-IA family hydrolase [Phenylobacterium sp.]|uniref:HAD-IA family hydrolase n=1 Tax=Phenylobacterium sp. TaxID=1871053 RepID=UPI0030F45828